MNGRLAGFRRVVVKIGSSLLINQQQQLNVSWLESLASDIQLLVHQHAQVMVVSSGAIALGRNRIRELHPTLATGSLQLKESQAAAAIGQIALSTAYQSAFAQQGLRTAQILLTIGDTEQRSRYLNARATVGTLLKWGVVPIINENDTVATTEIRYGDNDRLAARVASMLDADLLVLLSDVDGLYDSPPATNPGAKLIPEVTKMTPEIFAAAGDAGSALSRGGMKTKLEAARIATESGAAMVIASGHHEHPLKRIDAHADVTWFHPVKNSLNSRTARKKWIAAGLRLAGSVSIDNGALLALESGKSLLPAGVTAINGEFNRGDTVCILGPHGHTIGRGLVEYDAVEAVQIMGKQSREIAQLLGDQIRTELIHRDNLVMDK